MRAATIAAIVTVLLVVIGLLTNSIFHFLNIRSRRAAFGAFSLLATLTVIVASLVYEQARHEPVFTEAAAKSSLDFMIGPFDFGPNANYVADILKGIPTPFIGLIDANGNKFAPLAFYVQTKGDLFWRQKRLVFDFQSIAGDPRSPISIRANTVQPLPLGWDWNGNDNGMEVVNELGEPVFQFVYETATRARISGVFILGFSVWLVPGPSDTMVVMSVNDPQVVEKLLNFKLTPLFKHPGVSLSRKC
jgi:hypothetical protein